MIRKHKFAIRLHKLHRIRQQRRRIKVYYAEQLRKCQMTRPRVVVLTGAGISAESGIKTFRASDGLWEEHRVEDVATPEGYQKNPQLVQRFYNERRRQLQQDNIKPNLAHYALAELEQYLGDNMLLVTQNIDNLHERAGNSNVVHMHGELLKVRCVYSGKVFDWRGELLEDQLCHCCKRPYALRPHIVWFGEMPFEMDKIYRALEKADYFIAIGTSGHVYPAAGFVEYAKRHGAYTVELNLEPSQIESQFDEKHYGLASKVVPTYIHHSIEKNKEKQKQCFNCWSYFNQHNGPD